MRIMHVISSPAAGGAEVYVKDLAKSLVKHGNDVTIAFLGSAKEIGRSQDYENKFLDELDESGVSWEFIGNDCRKKPWRGISRIRTIAKKYDAEIYHSHLPFGVFFGAGLSCPRVYTHHSIMPRLNWLTYRVCNRLIERYVGISRICAEKLSVYTSREVTPILNGVDVNKFSSCEEGNPAGGEVVNALAVGRICPQKGYRYLGEAISLLPREVRSRIRVSIAGEGDPKYTAELKKFIDELGASDVILFLGNRSDIPQLWTQSDLFLMSSEWEGLPIALIEATVTGLPCIVTDVGGCAEIIEMCGNGVAVEYGDTEAFARELRELIENPSTRRKLSDNAVKNYTQLDIENSAQKHLALYEELLGARR